MNLIIYHKKDLDGVCSAAIALKKFGVNNCKLIGFDYGDESVATKWDQEMGAYYIQQFDKVIMMDVSFPPKDMEFMRNIIRDRFIWIDHHQTAINDSVTFGYETIKGIRENGVAACELTYKFFYQTKDHFLKIPKAIRLLSAYDVWNKETFNWDEETIPFQYGFRKFGLNPLSFPMEYLGKVSSDKIEDIIEQGKSILSYIKQKNGSECKQRSFEAKINGFQAICLNTQEFNSTTFDSVWNKVKYDVMCPFCFNGDIVQFSLYSTHEYINCGEIAKRFGGGGHKGAAGFQIGIKQFYEFMREKN